MVSFDEKNFKKLYEAAVNSVKNPGENSVSLPKHESSRYPTIYVFRHGETFDNLRRIHSGHRDSKLTKRGIEQAKAIQKKLKCKKIDVCITSHLTRSIVTAKIALKNHKNIKYEVDDRIIERDYGKLTGKSKIKMMRKYPRKEVLYRRGYETKPPGGESLKDVEKRVFKFCRDLVKRLEKERINVAISCHGNSMRPIRKYFENLSTLEMVTQENPLGQDYASYVVKFDNSYPKPH